MFGSGAIFLDNGHRRICINVTGAGAISKLTRGVQGLRILGLFMRPDLVVTRMTGRAVRLKCGELPYDQLCIGLMALDALQVASMVERFVGQARVTVVRGCPNVGVVTQIAFLRGVEVIRVLTGRSNTVVTSRTVPENLGVVNGDDRLPHGSTVTVFTNIRRLNMARSLAGGVRTVVAADTVANDICMVESGR